MPSCSVISCRSRTNKMHKFPEDLHLRLQWIAFCGREFGWVPRPKSKICSVHFLPSDITWTGRVKEKAVPQIIAYPSPPARWSEWDVHKSQDRLCKDPVYHDHNYTTPVVQVPAFGCFHMRWVTVSGYRYCSVAAGFRIRIRIDPQKICLLNSDPHEKCGSGSSCEANLYREPKPRLF
jgi:hypothetical protein